MGLVLEGLEEEVEVGGHVDEEEARMGEERRWF